MQALAVSVVMLGAGLLRTLTSVLVSHASRSFFTTRGVLSSADVDAPFSLGFFYAAVEGRRPLAPREALGITSSPTISHLSLIAFMRLLGKSLVIFVLSPWLPAI